jgi:DNA-binding XRE family transcriptional regulator
MRTYVAIGIWSQSCRVFRVKAREVQFRPGLKQLSKISAVACLTLCRPTTRFCGVPRLMANRRSTLTFHEMTRLVGGERVDKGPAHMTKTIYLDDCLSPTVRLFGKRMKQRRRELRLTQAQIFERTGIAATYLSMIENGRANPSLDTVEKLARAVGLEAWEILRLDRP